MENGSWGTLVAQGGGILENWVIRGVIYVGAWGKLIARSSAGDHKALSYLNIPE